MALRILLAGGGTAGHIEPAIAVADAIRRTLPDAECIFLGTEDGLENLLIPKAGYQLKKIRKVAMPRSINVGTLLFPFRMFGAVSSTLRALQGADIVIGFGGYISAAAYIAARIKKIPIVIHEANAKPGWANRLGRHFATVVAVTFEEVQQVWPGSIVTGIPLRESVTSLQSMNAQERSEFRRLHCESWGFDPNRPVVAIFGGSQGSQRINSVIERYLGEKNDHSEIQYLHAVGVNNPLPEKKHGYLPMPYFHEMAAVYASADLLVTRSGAVTCAEIATVGTYAILVPLPHGNGEQVTNADALVRQGRAISVANDLFTSRWLMERLPEALTAAKATGHLTSAVHVGAAERIAQLALDVVKR